MSISGRKNTAKAYKGTHDRGLYSQSHIFEDAIMCEAGVQCSVKVKENEVQVRTKDYTEYVLARSVIRQRTSLPIIRGIGGVI